MCKAALPKAGLAKLPASGASRGEGCGSAGLANCFQLVGISRLGSRKGYRPTVDHRVAEETVEGPQAEHIPRHAETRLVGEDNDAEIPVQLKGDDCGKAVSYAAVKDDVAVRRLLDHPTKCVERLIAYRDLRRARIDEVRRRNDLPAVESAVGKLKADPLRHVLNV
jgi:hypothetical protein